MRTLIAITVAMLCLPAAEPFGLVSLSLRPSFKGCGGRAATSARMSADANAMSSCARALSLAGDHTVAAAAILGENQREDEDPASLSAGGCAFANAGRDAEKMAAALAQREWEDATGPLADCAGSLFQAAASLASVGDPPVGTALGGEIRLKNGTTLCCIERGH